MLKKASTKETKEVPFMTKEDFLDRFYDGKIGYKLPSKYPENFALCTSYVEGKKEIPLAHRDKVGSILRDAYNALKPIIKKFRLSLGLLIESPVRNKGVAWTKKIKIDFSMPGVSGSREEVVAFTSMVQIKIRNPEFPQNPKKFLNKTSVLAILLHELAHIRHMHHGIRFAMFLKQLYDYAMMLGIFPEGEELMLPSSRQWERRMFETKGRMSDEELRHFFENNHNDTDDNEDHHDERVSDYERKEVSVNPEPVPRRRKFFEEDSKRTETKKKTENKKPEKPATRPKPKRPERIERPEKTERQDRQGRQERQERVGRTRGGAAAAAAEGKVVMITRKAVSMKPRTGGSLLDSAKPIKKIITIGLPDLKAKAVKVIEPSKTVELLNRRASAGENSGVVMVENQGREVVTMANETVEMEVEVNVNETVGNVENSLGNIVEKECMIDVAVTVDN